MWAKWKVTFPQKQSICEYHYLSSINGLGIISAFSILSAGIWKSQYTDKFVAVCVPSGLAFRKNDNQINCKFVLLEIHDNDSLPWKSKLVDCLIFWLAFSVHLLSALVKFHSGSFFNDQKNIKNPQFVFSWKTELLQKLSRNDRDKTFIAKCS